MVSMNIKMILIFTIFLFVAVSPLSVAKSNYATIDLYYNNQLYPSNATPKPVVNIGEPFKVKFEITCYRKVYLSVQLTELGSDSFEIIEEAYGTLKYKDSLISVKIIYKNDDVNGYINTKIYYLNNIEGDEHPIIDADNMIVECLTAYYDGKLILHPYDTKSRVIFLNIFDNEQIMFNQVVEN